MLPVSMNTAGRNVWDDGALRFVHMSGIAPRSHTGVRLVNGILGDHHCRGSASDHYLTPQHG